MAITYGMSVKEFWEDNPDLFWAYRFSYYSRLKEQQEIFNNNAWLQGAYIHEAVSVALYNSFSKQHIDYAKQPYELNKKEESHDAKIQQQVNDIKARISQVNKIREGSTAVIIGEDRRR